MIPHPRQSGFIRIYSFRCLTCAFLFLCLVPVINSWTCCQNARCLSELRNFRRDTRVEELQSIISLDP